GGQVLTVGAEGDAEDPVVMAAEGVQHPARRGVPKLRGLVPARGGQAPAVGTEGHALDHVAVAGKGVGRPPRRRVPDRGRAVPPRRGQAPAVGAEGNGEDGGGVRAKGGEYLLARRRVPEVHIPPLEGGGDPLAVGTERHGTGKAVEGSTRLARRH